MDSDLKEGVLVGQLAIW